MTIRRAQESDRPEWERLYAAYADFYHVAQSATMRARVWGWIHDPAQAFGCFVAEGAAGALVGLAHFRPYALPLDASFGGYLDDLFVDPAARGSGVARALIGAVADEGRAQGWTALSWITAEDNAPARALYDTLANAARWKTYEMQL